MFKHIGTQTIEAERLVLRKFIYDNVDDMYNNWASNPKIQLENVMGEKALIKRVNIKDVNIESRSYFPFRDVNYALNISNLVKDGFHIPSISLEEGLQKTFRWYVEACPKLSDSRMTMIEELIK